MTLHIVPEQFSQRPSRRKFIVDWERIDVIPSGYMQVCRVRYPRMIVPMYRVILNGQDPEYLAYIDEVDALWMGKTPEELDLDRADDAEPEYRKGVTIDA